MEALNDSARAGGERFFPGRRFLKTAGSFMDFPFLEPRGWGKSSAAQPRTNCSEFPYILLITYLTVSSNSILAAYPTYMPALALMTSFHLPYVQRKS